MKRPIFALMASMAMSEGLRDTSIINPDNDRRKPLSVRRRIGPHQGAKERARRLRKIKEAGQ